LPWRSLYAAGVISKPAEGREEKRRKDLALALAYTDTFVAVYWGVRSSRKPGIYSIRLQFRHLDRLQQSLFYIS
jgi:hypothetical protein